MKWRKIMEGVYEGDGDKADRILYRWYVNIKDKLPT